MPTVRGRFIPEVESTGGLKKCLDVLLWGNEWAKQNWASLDEIEVLRDYLRSMRPSFCGIRLFVPAVNAVLIETLGKLNIKFVRVETRTFRAEIEERQLWGFLWGPLIHLGASRHISIQLATTAELFEPERVAEVLLSVQQLS